MAPHQRTPRQQKQGRMLHSIKRIRKEIHAAFSRHLYPGDDKLALRQPNCSTYEGEIAWRFFRGKVWQEMVNEMKGSCSKINVGILMNFLTFEGFAYYLPAFLEVSLDVDRQSDVGESMTFKLWSFPEEVQSLLKPGEKRAVVQTLNYLAHEYEKRNYVTNLPKRALDDYWSYFTDKELGIA